MEQTKRIGIDLTEGNIFQQLMIFAVPILLANFVQQLYNTVDMVVIGQFVGSAGSTGVSNGGEVATLITFIASSFGSAGQIYVSQLYGAKKHREVNETLSTAMIFAMLLSVFCMVVCMVFCRQMLDWLNCPEAAYNHAKSYMLIVSLGLPAVFGYNMVCGILRGMGEAKRPLLFISIAAAANVVMDILLVVVIPLEAAGTAWATIIAQYASFAASLIFLYRRRHLFDLQLTKESVRINRTHLAALLKLGIPLTAQTALIHFTQLICTSSINTYGLAASNANSIGNRITKLVNIFTSSINQSAGAMVGQNIGAKKYDRVRQIVRVTFFSAAVCAVGACLIALFLPRFVYGIFLKSSDSNFEAILDIGVVYLRSALIMFIATPVQGSLQSVITGTGNAKLGLIAGLLDGVVLRLGFSYGLAYLCGLGVTGFFLGNGLARIGPITVAGIYYFSGKWKSFDLLKNISKEKKEERA